jgi:hypothetical protein
MTSTTTPAPPRTPRRPDPPEPAVRRVQVPQLALGVLLSGLAALGFVLFNATSVQRSPVLALASEVQRGQVLEVENLQVVHVGTDDVLALTPADRSDLLVGRAAVTDLAAGTLLTTDHVAAGATLTPGAGVVGLALAPGQYPTPRLAIGDLVAVVEVSNELTVLVEAAEVVGIEPVGTQGQRFISLQTGEPEATAVAHAAASGEVRLVLIARDAAGGEVDG